MDQVEDFYEALSAAIESGLDTPGAHAVSDMYRAAIALAEAAQAEASLRATERDRAIDRARSVEMQLEAAKTELKSTHDFYDLAIGVAQAHEARIDELKAQLAALQAAGEWRPVSEAPVTKGRYLTLHFQEGEYPLYDIQHWHDGTVPPGPPAQWHGGWTKGDDWAQPAYWRPLPTPPEATQ